MARLEGNQLVTVEAYDAVAFLATNDTALTLPAASDSLRIMSLKHRTAGWEGSAPALQPLRGLRVSHRWLWISDLRRFAKLHLRRQLELGRDGSRVLGPRGVNRWL